MRNIQLSAQLSSTNTVTKNLGSSIEALAEFITKNDWCVGTYTPREELLPQLTARESNRRNEFFIAAPSIFAVDIDNTYTKNEIAYPELTGQEAAKRLEDKGLSYLIAPTKNNKLIKEGHEAAGPVERFRVLLFLSNPITSYEDYKKVFKYVQQEIFPEMDRQCSDPARFYYRSTSVTYINISLAMLDVETCLVTQASALDMQLRNFPNIKKPEKNVKQKIPTFVSEALVDGLGESGGRNNRLYKVLQWYFKEKQYNYEQLLEVGLRLGLDAGLKEEEIQAAARSSMNSRVTFTLDERINGPLLERLTSSRLIYNADDVSDIVYIYDEVTGSYETFDMSVTTKLFPKEVMPLIIARTTAAKVIYEPFNADCKFILSDGDKEIFHKFNIYSHPAWRQLPEPETKAQLPALYEKFFKHLIKDDEASYEYLLDWLANAIKDRNFTVLCAIASEEGTGKGVLGLVMSNLVGESNYNKVRDEVFKNKFNKGLKNKRIVQLDEVRLKGDEELNRFKDIINTSVEIEAKGKDAELMKNYASFYLTSNNIDAIRPSASDRRFSIVEMTDVKLTKVFSQAEIDQLTQGHDIGQLGWFLLKRELKNNMMSSFKSGHYNLIREASQTMWQEYLLEDFAKENKNKEVPLRRVQQLLKEELGLNFHLGRTKLKAFCDDYKEYFEFKQVNGYRTIKPIKSKYEDAQLTATSENTPQRVDLFAPVQDNEKAIDIIKHNNNNP